MGTLGNSIDSPAFLIERSVLSRIASLYWKLGLLIAISLGEVMLATLAFDSTNLLRSVSANAPGVHDRSFLVSIVWSVRWFLRVGLVAVPVTLVLCGRPVVETVAKAGVPSFKRYVLPVLAGHAIIYGVFMVLSQEIFEHGLLNSSWGGLALVCWIGSGVAAVVSLLACVLPPRCWYRLERSVLDACLVGGCIGIAAVSAGQFASRLWTPLAVLTLELVHMILGVFETDLVYRPSEFVVGTEPFSVVIAPECSGYEGIGLITAFLGFYLIGYRRQLRFPHALLLLPLGALAIWLTNVVRIAALIELGTRVSSQMALSGFHSQAGWIAFCAVALGLVVLGHNVKFVRCQLAGTLSVEHRGGPSLEAVYLAPLSALVAMAMAGAAFSAGGFEPLYPLRLAAVALPLWVFRREYAALQWSVGWQSIAVGLIVYVLWIGQSLIGTDATGVSHSNSLTLPAPWAGLWILARVIGSVIMVPLAEELAFRGFLTRRLISADFAAIPAGRMTWYSFLLSSVAFGVLHHHWLEGSAAGMLYAMAYHRRGSMGDAVVAHATTNAMLSAHAVALGDWSIIS